MHTIAAISRLLFLALLLGLFPGSTSVAHAGEATPGVVTPVPVGTDTRSFVWTRVDLRVFIPLDERDPVHAIERLTVDFSGGPFAVGFREIPRQAGERYDAFQVDRIDGHDVRPLRFVSLEAFTRDVPDTYTIEALPGMVRVRWSFPSVTSQQQVFQLRYDAQGVLRERAGSQELSWIAVGEALARTAPVKDATLTIYLPRTIDAGQAVTGGSDRVTHSGDGRIWLWRAHDLTSGDSLWGSLRFP